MKNGRKRSKIGCALIVVLLIINSAMGVFAAPQVQSVAPHWAQVVIDDWLMEEWAYGYPDGTFQPEGAITRGEFMALANRAFGFDEEQRQPFLDVEETHWYAQEVGKAMKAGYIKGYPDGTMAPDNPISRQEAATMIAKIMDLKEDMTDSNNFLDNETIPYWSQGYIGAVAASGYMKGYPDGTFRPFEFITRAEALVALDSAVYEGVWVIREEGTMGPDEEQETIEKNVVVKTKDLTLQNVKIEGDLILETNTQGEILLYNVTVTGNVWIKGKGATIEMTGINRIQKMTVTEEATDSEIDLSQNTIIQQLILDAPAVVTINGIIQEALGSFARTSSYRMKLPVNLQPRPSRPTQPDPEPSEFAGGEGTLEDPWQVATAEQLNSVRNYLGEEHTDKYFIQTSDIDLGVAPWNEGEGWEPIGDRNEPFRGHYDGDHQVITGLWIDRNVNEQGLFGSVGQDGSVQNLGLEDVFVKGREYVGGLVGYADRAKISRCYTTGQVTANENYAYAIGGLVGYLNNYGTEEMAVINESYSTASVTGRTEVGGLVGQILAKAEVKNSYATGQVTGTGETGTKVGGLIGGSYDGIVINSYATSHVVASEAQHVGGLVGFATITWPVNSYWNKESSGLEGDNDGVGNQTLATSGVVGYDTNVMIMMLNSVPVYVDWDFDYIWTIIPEESYPYLRWQDDKNIPYPPSEFAGGEGTLEDPWQVATAEQLNNVRNYSGEEHTDKHFIQTSDIDLGVAPWNEGEGWEPIGTLDQENSMPFRGSYDGGGYTIENMVIDKQEDTAVGLFCYTLDATIKNVHLENVVIMGEDGVGSLIGYGVDTTVQNIEVTNGIVSGREHVGGLIGIIVTCEISNVTTSITVEGHRDVGGLIGRTMVASQEALTVVNAHASGNVIASDTDSREIGGLIGWQQGGIVKNVSAAGNVTGSAFVGGLVGRLNDGGIESAFATGNVFGNSDMGGLVGFLAGVVTDAYAWGNVTGVEREGVTIENMGGLVGSLGAKGDGDTISDTPGIVTRTYAIGEVSGDLAIGGLVGNVQVGTISDSYFLEREDVDGVGTGEGSPTAVSLEYLGYMITFPNWNFETESPYIWGLNPNENNTLPFLRWQGWDHMPPS